MNTTLTVDKAGRVVLPKPLRDELQLSAGDFLDWRVPENRIVLRPVRGTARMRQKKGIWVFRTGQPISAESVNETIHQLREERMRLALRPKTAKPGKRERPR